MKPPYHAEGHNYCTGLDGNRICTGAKMGRYSDLDPSVTTGKLRLRAIPLDSGGYDPGGAYWGHSALGRIYCAWNDAGTPAYVWATDRAEVKAHFPNARFYR